MSTLTITEETSSTEFNIVEQAVNIDQVVQTLDITQADNELSLNETTQTLQLLSPATNTLSLVDQAPSLDITPDVFILNQTFTGTNEALQITAGENLGGHRVVYAAANEAFYADHTDAAHIGRVIGITTGAASQGGEAAVRFAGTLTEPTWTWVPGPIYVSTLGTLTQTKPSTGWIYHIATALSPTEILLQRTVTIEVA